MNSKLTPQQERVLKLLFKFRFVSAQALANVMGIRRVSLYQVLEYLVSQGMVVKVYDESWRIDRKPAYYYLNHNGVTTVRMLMNVKEPVVHALYKNATASADFINHCLTVLAAYPSIKQSVPTGSELFTKSEINRFKQFPKNRPDLYIRTPDGREVMVVLLHDSTPYVIKKRLNELLTHVEDEGWDGGYPTLAFVLKDGSTKHGFMFRAGQMLEGMGIDQEELTIKTAGLDAITKGQSNPWSSVFSPKQFTSLL